MIHARKNAKEQCPETGIPKWHTKCFLGGEQLLTTLCSTKDITVMKVRHPTLEKLISGSLTLYLLKAKPAHNDMSTYHKKKEINILSLAHFSSVHKSS